MSLKYCCQYTKFDVGEMGKVEKWEVKWEPFKQIIGKMGHIIHVGKAWAGKMGVHVDKMGMNFQYILY